MPPLEIVPCIVCGCDSASNWRLCFRCKADCCGERLDMIRMVQHLGLLSPTFIWACESAAKYVLWKRGDI